MDLVAGWWYSSLAFIICADVYPGSEPHHLCCCDYWVRRFVIYRGLQAEPKVRRAWVDERDGAKVCAESIEGRFCEKLNQKFV